MADEGTSLDHLVGHGILGVWVGPVADAVDTSKVLVVPETEHAFSVVCAFGTVN